MDRDIGEEGGSGKVQKLSRSKKLEERLRFSS